MQRLYRRLIAPPAADNVSDNLSLDVTEFANRLISGVDKNIDKIDLVLAETSKNWKISRMAAVDRSILRLAIYEILFEDDIPLKVTINEAIELAKKYGNKNSGAFINGILDNVSNSILKDREDC